MNLNGEAAKAALMTMAAGMSKSSNPPKKAPVNCPECQAGLHYTERGVIHQDPPRRRVKCPQCEFKGFHHLESGDVI